MCCNHLFVVICACFVWQLEELSDILADTNANANGRELMDRARKASGQVDEARRRKSMRRAESFTLGSVTAQKEAAVAGSMQKFAGDPAIRELRELSQRRLHAVLVRPLVTLLSAHAHQKHALLRGLPAPHVVAHVRRGLHVRLHLALDELLPGGGVAIAGGAKRAC